eukprot:TRINITY_DN6185_c0_g1_i1.p1 TRINITY_DN6185_c0_g1~~TRINITY_DN6185_c0_g1_i1.p1  ORF type:complete len:485 (+),score=55.50 TRINITY_DN6185_c0_g1_i1:119-1573(+)
MQSEEITKLLRLAQHHASVHVKSIFEDGRSVGPSADSLLALCSLPAFLQDEERCAEDVLEELVKFASPAASASPGGRYFGFVTGGSLPIATAADWLVSVFDQNGWNNATSPMAAQFETVAISWLIELLSLPATSAGTFVGSCTTANIVALAVARDAVLSAVDWDVAKDGLIGAPVISIYLGAEAHSSVLKAFGVVGLGRGGGRHVTQLPVNCQGAVTSDAIKTLAPPDAPAIVVLQAGHVNTGAFDEFPALIAWARSGKSEGRGIWIHVDGAFGLWAAASSLESRRVLSKGVDGADSWATDLHKTLNVPYDSAMLVVRDGTDLRASMNAVAPYLQAVDGEPQIKPVLPECQNSRRARGLVAWATIRQLGRHGVASLVDQCCSRAQELCTLLKEGGVEIVCGAVFNQLLVSFGDDERTAAVVSSIQRDGRCWAGATRYRDRTVMRLSVSCWSTTVDDVRIAASAILECAAASRSEPSPAEARRLD